MKKGYDNIPGSKSHPSWNETFVECKETFRFDSLEREKKKKRMTIELVLKNNHEKQR